MVKTTFKLGELIKLRINGNYGYYTTQNSKIKNSRASGTLFYNLEGVDFDGYTLKERLCDNEHSTIRYELEEVETKDTKAATRRSYQTYITYKVVKITKVHYENKEWVETILDEENFEENEKERNEYRATMKRRIARAKELGVDYWRDVDDLITLFGLSEEEAFQDIEKRKETK